MTLQPISFVLLLLALVIELCRGASISGCIADERNALLNLMKNVEDIGSWKEEDCCNWKGVSCNDVTGHVVRLDLRNPCSYAGLNDCNEWSLRGELRGELSPSLLGLKQLNYLDLSFNRLNGSLPNWLGELHMLEYLDLSYNRLFGCIPESLGRLVALHELHLSSNKLNGTVPKSIGQLSNLIVLSLGSNFFEGVISEVHFDSLAKLKVLDLGSNNLILNVNRDWIPPFKLNTIRMGSCKIGPEFPRWLQTQVSLSSLDLSSSHIVDFLPDWFWNVFATHDSCIRLDLSNNRITGNLPQLSKLCFDYYNLSSNCFRGTLPPILNIDGSMMDISNNSFYGRLSQSCDSNKTTNVEVSVDEVIESDYWYVSIASGFVLGFLIVWGTLFLKKKWKDAYFRYIDYVYDAVFVAIALNINRFKRKLGNEIASG